MTTTTRPKLSLFCLHTAEVLGVTHAPESNDTRNSYHKLPQVYCIKNLKQIHEKLSKHNRPIKSINQSKWICIAPPTNSGRRCLTIKRQKNLKKGVLRVWCSYYNFSLLFKWQIFHCPNRLRCPRISFYKPDALLPTMPKYKSYARVIQWQVSWQVSQPTLVVVVYSRLTSTNISYLGRTPGSASGASLSPVHGFGTLCQRNSVSQTLNLLHFGGC